MKSYLTRWEFIEPYVHEKEVLDVGPAELMGTANRFKLQNSIHERISHVANNLIGLEKNSEQIQPLRELGYNIQQGDAEQFELDEDFDVIIAGELVEHLSNPGLFLDCARNHLREDGVILLTTPNHFSLGAFLSAFVHNRIPAYSKPIAKHVACYDENLLQDLLRRHGFTDFTVAYYQWVGKPREKYTSRIINSLLRRFRPNFLSGLMVVERLEK